MNAAVMDMMNPMRTKRISIIIHIILMSVKTGCHHNVFIHIVSMRVSGTIEHIFALMKICENRCRPQSTIFSAMWTAVLIILMENLVFDMRFFPHKMIKIHVRIEIRVFQIVYTSHHVNHWMHYQESYNYHPVFHPHPLVF